MKILGAHAIYEILRNCELAINCYIVRKRKNDKLNKVHKANKKL